MLRHLLRKRVVVVIERAADKVAEETSRIAMPPQLPRHFASISPAKLRIVDAQHEPRV